MRVCNVSKILSFILLLTFFSLSFCCVSIVNASDNDSIKECEYTEEYLKTGSSNLIKTDQEKQICTNFFYDINIYESVFVNFKYITF